MIFLFYIDIKKKISLRCFLTTNYFFKMFSKKKKKRAKQPFYLSQQLGLIFTVDLHES